MATCNELMDRLSAKLSSDPAIASNFNAVYKFVLEGDAGGIWLINLRDGATVEKKDGDSDCAITLAGDDFIGLVAGEIDGNQLYFQGKLQIGGDMGLALKLENLAELAR